jgi:hypothetical protein
LQVGEFGFVGVHVDVVVGDDVALGEAVEPEDLLGGRPAGGAFCRVQRQFGDAALAHGAAEFALDERLDEQREEVDEEQGFQTLRPPAIRHDDGMLRIGELASKTGESVRTLRYWVSRDT